MPRAESIRATSILRRTGCACPDNPESGRRSDTLGPICRQLALKQALDRALARQDVDLRVGPGRRCLAGYLLDGFLSLLHGSGYLRHQPFQIVLGGLKLRPLCFHDIPDSSRAHRKRLPDGISKVKSKQSPKTSGPSLMPKSSMLTCGGRLNKNNNRGENRTLHASSNIGAGFVFWPIRGPWGPGRRCAVSGQIAHARGLTASRRALIEPRRIAAVSSANATASVRAPLDSGSIVTNRRRKISASISIIPHRKDHATIV